MFICYVITVENASCEIHSSQKAQISSYVTETVMFLEAYQNFKNVFLAKNVVYLPPNKNHNHAIDFFEGK